MMDNIKLSLNYFDSLTQQFSQDKFHFFKFQFVICIFLSNTLLIMKFNKIKGILLYDFTKYVL